MRKTIIVISLFMVVLLVSCGRKNTTPATEFYFDSFNDLDSFLASIQVLEPNLSEDEIKIKFPDYNEENGKILVYYRHYVYADLKDAHERISDSNYKLVVKNDNVNANDIKGTQTLQFIYRVEDTHLKAIVLTIEPVSKNHSDYSSYVFVETDSSIRTIVNRNKAAAGYDPKKFVKNLAVDAYIENGKVMRPTYEIRYAVNETNLSKQNLRISFFIA